MGEGPRPGGKASARPGSDHDAANTRDRSPESVPHSLEPSQALSAPRRLTITIPGDEAEACQFTNGAIVGFWTDPPQLYAWLSLDALREEWPDAHLTWLDPEPTGGTNA